MTATRARVVTLRLRVPPWVSDEEVEKLAEELEDRLWRRVPVDALRQALGIRDEDLTYDLEA